MLSDVYFPRVNGVSTSIRTFARALLQMGHRVTLVVPEYGAGGGELEGMELIRLPARTIFFDPEDRLVRGGAMRDALERLSARRWDVIHIHTPFQAHRLGIRLSDAMRVPTVETYHTYFEEYVAHYLPWLPGGALRLFARRVSRALCHGVDQLIVPSEQMTQVLRRYGIQTPSEVIPTGIDLEEFKGGDGVAFRTRHGIPPDAPVLVTVSRLAVEKNIAFLLRVAARLRGRHPGLRFIIAGEGPDAPRLKRLATELGLDEVVRFHGNLDRATALLDAYRAGDAFVFASPTETQGLVLTEAMALGVPVVSTAVMGTAKVLEGTRAALVAPEDEAGFADAVDQVLSDRALRDRLSEAGPDEARRWSTDTLMGRVVSLYQRLLDEA
ncbi:glycosyltransferase [Marilutibacter penaei]|nr:glycosyltransferase [Lysobacter penaei]